MGESHSVLLRDPLFPAGGLHGAFVPRAPIDFDLETAPSAARTSFTDTETNNAMTAKRPYNRLSDEERIAQLQAKIEALKVKAQEVARPDMAVVRQAPKINSRLREFAQLANHNGRTDIANSTLAFLAGLDRMINTPPEAPRRLRNAGTASMSAGSND